MPLARFAAAGLVLLALALVGCSQDALLQKFASPEEQATAKKYVDDLRAGQYAQIEAVMDSRLKSPRLRVTLEQMAAAMPDEEPSSVKLVGANSTVSTAGTTRNLTFEYRFSDRWLLVNVATHRKGDELLGLGRAGRATVRLDGWLHRSQEQGHGCRVERCDVGTPIEIDP